MIVAVCNVMVLKGQLRIESGEYEADDLVALIVGASSSTEDLSYLIHGCDITPCFSGCADFKDYPKFLTELHIRMLHAMVPDPESRLFSLVSQYDYDSLTLKLTDENLDPDERQILEQWWETIQSQATPIGLEVIDHAMSNNDVVIFFRGNHFSVLYKTMNRVFSLVTDRGFLDTNCFWQTLPNELGESKYFDDRFILSELQSNNTPRMAAVIVRPVVQQPPRPTQQRRPAQPPPQRTVPAPRQTRNVPRRENPPRPAPRKSNNSDCCNVA